MAKKLDNIAKFYSSLGNPKFSIDNRIRRRLNVRRPCQWLNTRPILFHVSGRFHELRGKMVVPLHHHRDVLQFETKTTPSLLRILQFILLTSDGSSSSSLSSFFVDVVAKSNEGPKSSSLSSSSFDKG